MKTAIWLRRDLRITDNPALFHACEQATGPVIAIYLITPAVWHRHDEAPGKIAFQLDCLQSLASDLASLNISLLVEVCDDYAVTKKLQQILHDHDISHLYFNRAIEPDERADDQYIIEWCKQQSIRGCAYQQACILSPGSVVKQDSHPYTVFTPFKNQWLKVLPDHDVEPLAAPKKVSHDKVKLSKINWDELKKPYQELYDKKQWPPSEKSAQKRLKDFIDNDILKYDEQRDKPDLDKTSRLSVYLAAGVISARQCFAAAQARHKSKGQQTWINELIWRDFYQHILYFFPRVGKHRAFKLSTEKLTWNEDEQLFIAWCTGQTGVPIVDAAMRQLLITGWMHNRLRMVVAMFLTKNCWIDWRKGEKFFMQHLLDGDLAANNGGWQWSASTGTDAVPYFRVFNPYRQSERFDPNGDFIRYYCPELRDLSAKEIHQPPKMENYPEPIVDVKKSRKAAIEAFKSLG